MAHTTDVRFAVVHLDRAIAGQGRLPVLAAGNRRAAVRHTSELRGRATGTCRSAVDGRSPVSGA